MPTFQFEAMDATGQEIRDVIDAATEEEAQTTIRQMGYFVTKIAVKKAAATTVAGKAKKKRGLALGGGGTKHVCAFTRQLSILQDAGLPILRSLKILEQNAKAGKLKFALQDVCEEIETGAFGSAEQVSESLHTSVREYDQGRRGGWRVGGHSAATRRVYGAF